jgi:hypothetical protein
MNNLTEQNMIISGPGYNPFPFENMKEKIDNIIRATQSIHKIEPIFCYQLKLTKLQKFICKTFKIPTTIIASGQMVYGMAEGQIKEMKSGKVNVNLGI